MMRLTFKPVTSLILLSAVIMISGCEGVLTEQPTSSVNKQYNSTGTYTFDSRVDHFEGDPTIHQQNVLAEIRRQEAQAKAQRELQLEQEKTARIQKENVLNQRRLQAEQEKAMAAQNALQAERERTQRAQQAQIAADRALAERLQAEENAAAARQAKEAADRQKALEARNNAERVQRDREAKQRAIEAQIASDRALAERLQREEIEAFQRQQAAVPVQTHTVHAEASRPPVFAPEPVQAAPAVAPNVEVTAKDTALVPPIATPVNPSDPIATSNVVAPPGGPVVENAQ